MTREERWYCDQCRASISRWVYTYGHSPLPGTTYATYEGMRHIHHFCSDGCMFTWLIWALRERARI